MAQFKKLFKYSEEKLKKLQDIERATLAQRDAIAKDDFTALNSLAEEKQKAINYIDWCDDSFRRELKEIKEELGVESFGDIMEGGDSSEKKALANIIGDIIHTIERTQAIEKANHQKLIASMDRIRGKLKKVRTGQRSVAMYESGVNLTYGSFLDKKK